MSRAIYQIKGGNSIEGEIECFGAKNFATKAIVASLLGNSPTTLFNIPSIQEIDITINMLAQIGVQFDYLDEKTLRIDPSQIRSSKINLPDSGTNRVPILLLSVLLHLFQEASVPVLGGCNIGERKIDFHLSAIEKFGGEIEEYNHGYEAHSKNGLVGTHIELPYPSVGATETCLYLGILSKGSTLISNAAIEPEIFELITMLRAMGAIIFTTPGREIKIEGVPQLKGTNFEILGDRIEAASWAALACASQGDITVQNIRPETLGNFLSFYRRIGGEFDLLPPNAIRFYCKESLAPAIIETDVYPGFSTDWQQPFAVLLTQADGISVIHDTVYENRFGYLDALNKLGAKTQLTTECLGGTPCRFSNKNHLHSAIIIGKTRLQSDTSLAVPDLRAGLAYVIAAAISEGTTQISGIEFIERGYGNIVPRLQKLNLGIERLTYDPLPEEKE